MVLDVPFVVLQQVLGSMVQNTVLVPQVQSIEGRRLLLRAAEANTHGPACSENHGDSAVAACQVVAAPVVQVVLAMPVVVNDMAEVAASRVERWRKSARERRAQALRAEALRVRRAQAVGAAMAHRRDLFFFWKVWSAVTVTVWCAGAVRSCLCCTRSCVFWSRLFPHAR